MKELFKGVPAKGQEIIGKMFYPYKNGTATQIIEYNGNNKRICKIENFDTYFKLSSNQQQKEDKIE